MNLPARYRRPVLIAVTLHVLLLIAMIVRMSSSSFRAPPAYQPKPFDSIQATAILPQTVAVPTPKPVQPTDHEKQEEQQEKAQLAKMQAEKAQEQKQHAQQLAAQKAAQEKKAAAVLAQKLHAIELQKEAQLQAQIAAKAKKQKQEAQAAALEKQRIEKELEQQQKAKAAKLAKEKADKLAKLQKQKALKAQQQKLQQAMMQQQLNSEAKDISQVQSQATQGAIDKYKAQILALVQSNWRIDQVNSKLKCIYNVSLAPDGTVLSVTLVRSSGDTDLDNSAKQAILQSSPLPVPQDPALFDRFRQLVLTLSPQGYLQSVA